MKNIQLIAFLFVLVMSAGRMSYLFADDKEMTVSLTKINLPYIDVRGSVKADKWNYGVALSSEKLFNSFVFSFKTGNLSSSGSLSRLNSPALSSTVNAFTSSAPLHAYKLEASLPQYNSFSSPQSYFCEVLWKPGKIVKQVYIDLLYNSAFTSSAGIKLSPWKKTDITFCTTGGLYSYDKKNISTWFSDEKFYSEGEHLCFNNQFSIACGNFSSLFVVSTYISPFGEYLNTWRTENRIRFKRFSFNLNGFYNPNEEVITSSDKKIKPLLQLSGGWEYRFLTETKLPFSITTGFNSKADINLSEKNHTLKAAAGFKYSSYAVAGLITLNINMNLINTEEGINTSFTSGSADVSNTFYINDFTATLKGDFTFTPDAKKTKWTFNEKIGINFDYETPGRKCSFTNKNQVTFTQKTDDSKNKIAFTSTLSAKFQFHFCTLRVHLEFQV